MKTLHVELGDRSYPIHVGDGLLARAGAVFAGMKLETPPVVVTNGRVFRLHGRTLMESLEGTFGGGRIPVIRIGDGERYKNRASLEKIHDGLFRAGADRRSWILAFGGGVVGDVAGFAAATFLRGIRYAGIPTTLLAQVDSSIGGKVAINVAQGKNLIGAFHQPSAVIADTRVLCTLPKRELCSGLYEVIKCAAIGSRALVRYLERRMDEILRCEPGPLEHVILSSLRIKAGVVSEDEREQGRRMILNFGHTIGHALEAATQYRRFRHGEAVAWGMLAALDFGREQGMTPDGAARLERLIGEIEKLPSLRGIPLPAVRKALRHDKKFRSGEVRMVLLPELGRAAIREDLEPDSLSRFVGRFLAARGKAGRR